jgi:hypothetical protein
MAEHEFWIKKREPKSYPSRSRPAYLHFFSFPFLRGGKSHRSTVMGCRFRAQTGNRFTVHKWLCLVAMFNLECAPLLPTLSGIGLASFGSQFHSHHKINQIRHMLNRGVIPNSFPDMWSGTFFSGCYSHYLGISALVAFIQMAIC